MYIFIKIKNKYYSMLHHKSVIIIHRYFKTVKNCVGYVEKANAILTLIELYVHF